ncbi:hypothetical protein MPSEU_000007300 [Mayamaea pseudoterrestris]|nr:hypothetical protein MPSEU_000007300 [Mayamaea pseudoterrestris]
MKITILAASVFLASASKFNLRSIAKTTDATPSQFTDARLAVFGLKAETTPEDVDIISASFKSAYNELLATPESHMVSFEPESMADIAVEIPELSQCRRCNSDDDMKVSGSKQGAMVVGRVGFEQCRRCNSDDALAHDEAEGTLQEQLSAKFCEKLRDSGSKVLAHARDCSVSFLDMTVADKADHAQISLKGLLHDFSRDDADIFNQAVTAAYNDAFLSAGYNMHSIEAFANIDMAPVTQCRRCNSDDETSSSSTAVLAHVRSWQCNRCNSDDALNLATPKQLELMEVAFKKAFCTKLQNSGSANFANVHGCDFSFVYSAVGADANVLTSTA